MAWNYSPTGNKLASNNKEPPSGGSFVSIREEISPPIITWCWRIDAGKDILPPEQAGEEIYDRRGPPPAQLACMAGVCLGLAVLHVAIDDSDVRRRILIASQHGQVDIFIAPDLGGVFARKTHGSNNAAQAAAVEGIRVQRGGLKGLAGLRIFTGIPGRMKGQYRGLVYGDVVRVVIAAHLIEGEHDLWSQPAHVGYDLGGHVTYRCPEQGLGILVVFGPGHTGISKT